MQIYFDEFISIAKLCFGKYIYIYYLVGGKLENYGREHKYKGF